MRRKIYFGCDTGMDGKPVQFRCDGLRSFIRRAAVCKTEDKGCNADEGRPDRTELQ